MKTPARYIKNRIEAMAGRSILTIYRAYSAVFIKKEGFPPPSAVRQQEIIVLKRTGHVYRIAAKKCIVQ